MDTPLRAMTEPKCLTRLRTSMSGTFCVAMSALPRHALADHIVEDHGEQQHPAEEHEVPVLVDGRVRQSDQDHAEYDRAEEGADRRAVAAGQQAAADHRGNDGLELLLEAAAGIG